MYWDAVQITEACHPIIMALLIYLMWDLGMKLNLRLIEQALLLTTKPSLQPFSFEMGFCSQNLDLMSQLQWLNTESPCQYWDSRCHCHTGFYVGAGIPNIVPRTCLTRCTRGWTHGLTDAKARAFPIVYPQAPDLTF